MMKNRGLVLPLVNSEPRLTDKTANVDSAELNTRPFKYISLSDGRLLR